MFPPDPRQLATYCEDIFTEIGQPRAPKRYRCALDLRQTDARLRSAGNPCFVPEHEGRSRYQNLGTATLGLLALRAWLWLSSPSSGAVTVLWGRPWRAVRVRWLFGGTVPRSLQLPTLRVYITYPKALQFCGLA